MTNNDFNNSNNQQKKKNRNKIDLTIYIDNSS